METIENIKYRVIEFAILNSINLLILILIYKVIVPKCDDP